MSTARKGLRKMPMASVADASPLDLDWTVASLQRVIRNAAFAVPLMSSTNQRSSSQRACIFADLFHAGGCRARRSYGGELGKPIQSVGFRSGDDGSSGELLGSGALFAKNFKGKEPDCSSSAARRHRARHHRAAVPRCSRGGPTGPISRAGTTSREAGG